MVMLNILYIILYKIALIHRGMGCANMKGGSTTFFKEKKMGKCNGPNIPTTTTI